jgi:hypothetical protein
LAQEILDLDVEEKKAHDNTWKKRGAFGIRLNNVLREIATDVDAVIEGEDDESVISTPSSAVPKMALVGVAIGEGPRRGKRDNLPLARTTARTNRAAHLPRRSRSI